jgi:hypothetical protein
MMLVRGKDKMIRVFIDPVIDNYLKCNFTFVNIPHHIHKGTYTLYDYVIFNY